MYIFFERNWEWMLEVNEFQREIYIFMKMISKENVNGIRIILIGVRLSYFNK